VDLGIFGPVNHSLTNAKLFERKVLILLILQKQIYNEFIAKTNLR